MIDLRLFVDCVGIALIGLFVGRHPGDLAAAWRDWCGWRQRR